MVAPHSASTETPTAGPTASGASSSAGPEDLASHEAQTTSSLLDSLGEDRLWLLRQLDAGRWPEWRLDLAALERELGQLIDQARERLGDA